MRAATAHHESRSTSQPTLRWGYGDDMANESLVPGFTNKRLFVVLGALALAVMLANLETSIIATALPTITGQFNAFESFAWVGTAYIVTSAISTPLLGKLSDLYGRRMIFQITMGLFLVGSILCGASQSIGQLIAARAFVEKTKPAPADPNAKLTQERTAHEASKAHEEPKNREGSKP